MPRTPPPDERRCTAEMNRGGRCTGHVVKGGDGLCVMHDPVRRGGGQRKNPIKPGERRGGHTEANRVRIEYRLKLASIELIPATLEMIAEDIVQERIEPKVGNVLAKLAAVAVQAHTAIDDLADRAFKRRGELSDEQIHAALKKLREAQARQRESLS